MIDCTSAYNAARVILDVNKIDIELITKLGYECPMFTRLVYMSRDNDTLLLLLNALERANIDVYSIERGLRYALSKKLIYNNATLQQNKDSSYVSDTSTNTTVNDNDAGAFVLDLDKENMRMLEHRLKRFHDMTARELYKACVDRDIAKLCKDKKKPTLIAALRKYEIEHAATSGIVIENDATTRANGSKCDSVDADGKYIGLTAKQLYELCKQRDIDVPARQNKQIYIDLLTSDDAIMDAQKNSENATQFNEEDWNI